MGPMPSDRHSWPRRPRSGAAEPVSCVAVAELLPGMLDGEHRGNRHVQRHISSCLRCQAELAQYRRLLRALHTLRTETVQVAPGVLNDILVGLEASGERRAVRSALTGRRAAYIGGVALATAAAGAAGAVVLVSRASRRRVRLAG